MQRPVARRAANQNEPLRSEQASTPLPIIRQSALWVGYPTLRANLASPLSPFCQIMGMD